MTGTSISEIEKTFKPISDEKKAALTSEYVGKRFGLLTVIEIVGRHQTRRALLAECICDCGNSTFAALTDIRRRHKTSCGCRQVAGKKIHGESNSNTRRATSEYLTWASIKNKVKKNSGGDFESCVYDRWLEKDSGYLNFLADMGRRPGESMLKRHDKAKPYSKENCYWRPNKTTKASRMTELQKQDAEFDKAHVWTES